MIGGLLFYFFANFLAWLLLTSSHGWGHRGALDVFIVPLLAVPLIRFANGATMWRALSFCCYLRCLFATHCKSLIPRSGGCCCFTTSLCAVVPFCDVSRHGMCFSFLWLLSLRDCCSHQVVVEQIVGLLIHYRICRMEQAWDVAFCAFAARSSHGGQTAGLLIHLRTVYLCSICLCAQH